MNCEGGFGKASDPSANLMAISQELAAERYNSDEIEDKRLVACLLSFSGAPLLQRKTLVSSKYFTISFLISSHGALCPQRHPEFLPGEGRRNHPEWSSDRGRPRACARTPVRGWEPGVRLVPRDWRW